MAFITTQDHDGVRVITLDHPPVNSLSYALSGELVPIVEAASADTSITAVVFIGANGQFSAGAAVIRNTLCGVFGAALVGWMMDRLQALHGGGLYYLRYAFAWQILFQVAILIVLYLMYREWKRLGGSRGFKPPPVGSL